MTTTLAPAPARARTLRAAVYLRISDDKLGNAEGVEDQRPACLAIVDAEGWEFVPDVDGDCFIDNDISAFTGKRRPAYERLMSRLAAGDIDVVIARHPERLHRTPSELEEWIVLQEKMGAQVRTVKEGLWNLSTPGDRLVARILGAVAASESDHKRDRIRDKMNINAAAGKWHGPLRVYGYSGVRNADGTHTITVVEDEAAVIREAARRVLSGEPIVAVTRDLNSRGIKGMKGGPLTHQAIRRVLLSARIAGWREHTPGRQQEDRAPWAGGEFAGKGSWPAIVERSDVERLRRMLGDPGRQHGPQGRTYVLSGGLAVCGRCGGNLRGKPGRYGRNYVCPSPSSTSNGKGCGGVSIGADKLEAAVLFAVREAHASGRFTVAVQAHAADTGADEAWAAVTQLRADIEALGAEHGAGRIPLAVFLAALDPMTARLDAAERDLARRHETESRALLVGGLDEFDARWAADEAAGELSRMRARLRAALVEVRVNPAGEGKRITPVWRA